MTNCCISKCKSESAVVYANKELCDKHWDKISKMSSDEAKEFLGIKRRKQ